MLFHSGVIDAQELGRTGHGVNVKMLSFSSLFVHKTEYRIGRIGVLGDNAGDLEQGPAQRRRTALGDAAGLGIEDAGLEGRPHPFPQKPPERPCG